MGIKVGICGTGSVSRNFIPLFKHHPGVDSVVLCDLVEEKLTEAAKHHEIDETYPGLDVLCDSNVDAIAIFTQNDRHGPQALQALEAGKHVYSAVPSAITVEEITALVRKVEETGLIYQIGETSYYYPCAIYCRNQYDAGAFGRIVFSEAQYFHDFDHGLYDVKKWRFGDEWEHYAGIPPLYYPTHSLSLVVSVTGAHVTHVSAHGVVDEHEDGLFTESNAYANVFSDETVLCKMSDGSSTRINEFRRIGHPGEVSMSMFGTEGSYEEQVDSQIWVTKKRGEFERLNELLSCTTSEVEDETSDGVVGGDWIYRGESQVHPVDELPREYMTLNNGHKGSHKFLVHEFVTSVSEGTTPKNNVWQAARYLIPGLIGHESAKAGAELMEVPDLGSGPTT